MKFMKSAKLLALLQAAYPNMVFRKDTYWAEKMESEVIFLIHKDVAIHDPMASGCGRFVQEDRYGLSDEHAKMLRRHNRDYDHYELGHWPDLPFVYKKLVEATQNQPDADPAEFLDEYGFYPMDTGGGCMAYALFNKDDGYILVTDDDSRFPTKMGKAWIGRYNSDQEEQEGHFPEFPPDVTH